MTILWTTNMPICAIAKDMGLPTGGFGGWMEQAFNDVTKNSNIKLVVVTSWNNKELKKKIDGNVVYYVIPGGDCYSKFNANKHSNKNYVKKILDEEKPDLMHLWGSESQLGLAFIRSAKAIPTVVYLQGVMKSVVEHYFESTTRKSLQKNITFYDLLKGKRINKAFNKLKKKAQIESDVLQHSGNIICDNQWCEAICKGVNNQLYVYHQNLPIDDVFKNNVRTKSAKKQIFCASQYAPFKGFEVLLHALKIVKERFSDVVLNVPGGWKQPPKSFKEKLRYDTYSKTMNNLICKLGLEDNVCNLGGMSREKMAKQMSEASIFVQSSTVENHSSTMREAMFSGVPCIVSNVGCAAEYVQHGVNGYLFRNNEPEVLAHYIIYLLENEALANEIGEVGRQSIVRKYLENENLSTLSIYERILSK